MSRDLEKQVLKTLEETPGQSARDIGDRLNVDKKQINSLLYGKLKGAVTQDSSYKWYLANDDNSPSQDEDLFAETDLASLCRYYLSCLGQEDTGISTFAHSKYGDPDYVELPQIPMSSKALNSLDEFQTILGRIRSDRSRQTLYLGYPTALKLLKSKKSDWEGYMVEPLLLFPIDTESDNGTPTLDFSFPIINQNSLKNYTNADRDALMDELVQLEQELGIGQDNAAADIDEIALRLQSVRSEWPWQEQIDPDRLAAPRPPLSELEGEGIYNRAVIISAQRSPFTQGLEVELRELAKLNDKQLQGTALDDWLHPKTNATPFISVNKELLEVLPMNLEQRTAVESALTNKLSIITGPPGTGKSQVVTNLLINAAWHGKKVLFASKNNMAVDVVETRINNLGSRPILLRVGSNAYQTKLAEYLMALLGSTSTVDDEESFQDCEEHHEELINALNSMERLADKVIDDRNTTDSLEKQVESLRDELSQERFKSIKEYDVDYDIILINQFADTLHAADKENQGLVLRIIWPLIRIKKLKVCNENIRKLDELANRYDLKLPATEVTEASLQDWLQFTEIVETKLADAKLIKDYFSALSDLQSNMSLEEISSRKKTILDKIAKNSDALWKLWLRLQPSKLTPTDRTKLNRYNSVLKMVIEAGPDGKLGKKAYKEYNSIFPEVSHLLPCWAVTSLSARGKIPFQPGFFDIVIFDEASQCDIASAIPLLYRAKSAVVIGDPKQLSHISGLKRGQDQQLLEKFGLLSSHPHWAYSYNSLFDVAAGNATNENVISLLDHHRSHADIIEFSNSQFYEGKLRVATRYDFLKKAANDEPGIRWVNVKGNVSRPATGGAINREEVGAVVNTVKDLLINKGYQGSVGVVSPFRAQANAITAALRNDGSLDGVLQKAEFLSDTVHKFQGDERDVMIFSPVISKNMPAGGLGFLKNNGNLFNVAITRARAQLIVVGDLAACGSCEVDYLENFATYAEKLKDQTTANVKSYKDLGPEYPKVNNPEQVSEWEHILYKALYQAGIRTIPQYRLEKYALDLALIDDDRKLDIEVDGEKYHRNWTGELCRRDQIRNQRMFELGWDVMRFWVYEIRDDLPGCVDRVKAWIESQDSPESKTASVHNN